MSAHAEGHPGRLQGPVVWVVSVAVGLLLGVGLGRMLPARHAEDGAGHERSAVFETRSDGSVSRILADGRSVPAEVPEPGQAAPEPAAAEPAGHTGREGDGGHGSEPEIPLWLVAPFVLLLASIALMPFVSARFWHRHYPDVAFLLGAAVLGYYVTAFGAHGRHTMAHVALEYYSFIALVGGLYVAAGGVLIHVNVRGTPLNNAALLAFGAVLANLVGTTGASMVLIRPFLRMNRGRLRAMHVVMFIFIVSNCGGCLTPIGDPPLYLGYLKGVPFAWTIVHLWPMWLVCNGLLLGIFMVLDALVGPAVLPPPPHDPPKHAVAGRDPEYLEEAVRPGLHVDGAVSMLLLALIVAAVFVDPALERYAGVRGVPVGATVQVGLAGLAWWLAKPEIHTANRFTFLPAQEVGFLFAGIFLTMAPALGYLEAHAAELGIESPTQFYFVTGLLSAVLDNAPTYLNFLQAACGVLHIPLEPAGVQRFLGSVYTLVHSDGTRLVMDGGGVLRAISLGAVFFGAMTYIGNGPNFMVKAIAEARGVPMPSFFGYLGRATLILLPVLVLVWAIFIR